TALLGSSEERSIAQRREQVEASARELSSVIASAEVTPALRAILSVPSEGVRVTGISAAPGASDADARMSVTGVASTREALRRYHSAVAALDFVKNADLPLSVYAAETELAFTIM